MASAVGVDICHVQVSALAADRARCAPPVFVGACQAIASTWYIAILSSHRAEGIIAYYAVRIAAVTSLLGRSGATSAPLESLQAEGMLACCLVQSARLASLGCVRLWLAHAAPAAQVFKDTPYTHDHDPIRGDPGPAYFAPAAPLVLTVTATAVTGIQLHGRILISVAIDYLTCSSWLKGGL